MVGFTSSSALLLAVAARALAQTDFSVVTGGLSAWNQSEWSLTTDQYLPGQYQSRISLANGYVGASLAAAGPFFEFDVNQTDPNGIPISNGWPLFDQRLSFTTISGFYDVQANTTGTNFPWLLQYGWESVISGIPHATAIIFKFGDHFLDATVSNETISNFASKLTFRTGVAEWSYTWSPPDTDATFDVSYTAIFSRERPNVIAVEASITASKDISGTATDLLDGRSALRTYLDSKGLDDNTTSIFSAVHPNGLPHTTGYVVSTADFSNPYTDLSSRAKASGSSISGNESTIGQTFDINLKAGKTATFHKYVGVASSDKFSNPGSVARKASAQAAKDGWGALLAEHIAAWARLVPDSSVDNFTDPVTGELPEDPNVQILQISAVANTFYLVQSLQPDGSGLNDGSIAVGGLASDSYAGLIFWDADYWMAPGLNLAFPSLSKQIANFRTKQYPQALDNAAFNGYPNNSALYSWTAGKYGNCTGTGPCVDYEYHLNYDIAFNLFQIHNITNNDTWFDNGPRQIIESIAVMTGELLKYNETTQTWWLHNMTDPDEYANHIDNGAFTVASASDFLDRINTLRVAEGLQINDTWFNQSQYIEFPTAESNITLEYQTMNNSVVVKQADVVLLTYPLDYSLDYTSADKLLDLDYYANRQSPDGPAMTYSVFAVNANALSPSGCSAYTYTLNSVVPYLRGPWYQLSEQIVDDPNVNGGTNPAFPFLTGHGGANQVVPFGFLGIRTDQAELYINPSLPPQIPNVQIRTFYFAGATFSATMNSTHTDLTRLETPASSGLIDRFENTTIPFIVGTPNAVPNNNKEYKISINQTISIPNRLYWKTLTDEGNLLQCQPVESPDSYAPGQFPIAAIDGATSTAWQPASNSSASLIVNMTSVPPHPVKGILFNWGVRPPINATVYLGNRTDGEVIYGVETIIAVDGISPDITYNPANFAADAAVVPVVGNSTVVAIAGSAWSGEYVRLEIEGCWEKDGDGATVTEFVLVGA